MPSHTYTHTPLDNPPFPLLLTGSVATGVFDEWNLKGTGPLATNGIDAGVKVRPTEAELKKMESWPTPHFQSGWESYFKNKPDKPVMHYSVIAGWFGDHMLMCVPPFFLSLLPNFHVV